MDEKTLWELFRVLYGKMYELQLGFTAMFNSCVDHHAFTERAFHAEKSRLESLPDFQRIRAVVERLNKPMEREDLEKILREYEGPIQ